MHVPQELIDLIVDHLDADVSSLQSCALTARTFVSPSQSHLFRKIEIRPESVNSDNDSSPSQQFYHTLTASPHLASLVRELRIVLVGSETPWEWDERHGDYSVERPAPWVMSDPALPLLLPLLHLTGISLVEDVANSEWNGEGAFCMHWGRLAPPLKSALTAVFSSYTLESVHLRGLVVRSPRELLSLFSDSVSLKSLPISRIFFDPAWAERNSWPEEQPWKPRLRTLLICDFYSQEEIISRFLNPRIDLSHLTSLTIAAKEHAWQDNLDKMVEANVFRCLEHPTVLKDKTINLNSCISPTLRTLHTIAASLFPTMLSTFVAVPVDSRLEMITFDSVPAPFPHDATPLNRAIELALDRLRFLKRVDINTLPFRETDFAVWAASIRSALPALESRDLLSMTDLSGAGLEHYMQYQYPMDNTLQISELIAHIIQYVDPPQHLGACALVARGWVHPAQPRIFSDITISTGDEERGTPHIQRLLAGISHKSLVCGGQTKDVRESKDRSCKAATIYNFKRREPLRPFQAKATYASGSRAVQKPAEAKSAIAALHSALLIDDEYDALLYDLSA
ncbi:hypothetical protein FB45DRAFT_1067564 [Roridomyces roridus]|uniref:Uncharacterized protein n=1 Tax=Roridomyces roridus TaxID=1738132 RepID=A0AAD7B1U4_9AGAR|nr:hypothetical protein FB45DRAFT_1067564 [Roridomyces roridus]